MIGEVSIKLNAASENNKKDVSKEDNLSCDFDEVATKKERRLPSFVCRPLVVAATKVAMVWTVSLGSQKEVFEVGSTGLSVSGVDKGSYGNPDMAFQLSETADKVNLDSELKVFEHGKFTNTQIGSKGLGDKTSVQRKLSSLIGLPTCGLVVQSFEAEVDGRIEVMASYEGLWCSESATIISFLLVFRDRGRVSPGARQAAWPSSASSPFVANSDNWSEN